MKATDLIKETKDIFPSLVLCPDENDGGVYVKKQGKQVFYFSIPNQSEEKTKKEFVGFLSLK